MKKTKTKIKNITVEQGSNYSNNPYRNMFIAIVRNSLLDSIYGKKDTFLHDSKPLQYLCDYAGFDINLLLNFKEKIIKNKIKRVQFIRIFNYFIKSIIDSENKEEHNIKFFGKYY
ncbi:MAG: hypothetical protein LBD41_05050 [Clostridiales Family XIII bacterium]|jgi:hypothetical protein|nr:hypothetical protein [Clostridiales Family XIII bacterium]